MARRQTGLRKIGFVQCARICSLRATFSAESAVHRTPIRSPPCPTQGFQTRYLGMSAQTDASRKVSSQRRYVTSSWRVVALKAPCVRMRTRKMTSMGVLGRKRGSPTKRVKEKGSRKIGHVLVVETYSLLATMHAASVARQTPIRLLRLTETPTPAPWEACPAESVSTLFQCPQIRFPVRL